MGNNIANIATTPVDVYLGPVGSDITNLASWHCLGWCKAGQTKLSTSDVRQVKTARGLTLEDRKEMQRALTARGFDTEGADGVIGSKTTAAISAYQQSAGLPVTGEPSAALLRRLRGS